MIEKDIWVNICFKIEKIIKNLLKINKLILGFIWF